MLLSHLNYGSETSIQYNVNVNFEAMNIKNEIEDILYATDLKPSEVERLTEKLFNLHIVSHSYYQVVFDGRNDDMQEVTAGLKTLEEAKQALEDNKKHFDEPMYIVAKINCG